MQLSANQRLLVACSAMESWTGEPLEELASQPGLRWDRVVEDADWHRVSSVVFDRLGATGLDGMAGPHVEPLRSAYWATLGQNLCLGAALERLLLALGSAGIDVVLLKGAALVPDAYHDPGLRPMCDLDLLLHECDLRAARAQLGDLGYSEPPEYTTALIDQRRTEHHHWPPVLRSDGRVAVELHHHLGHRGGVLGFDLDEFWQRARPATRGAAPCLVPAPEDQLLHTSLHFLHHHLGRSYGALGQLCDVNIILHRTGGALDWELVARESVRHGVAVPLAFVLTVVRELFHAAVPDSALRRMLQGVEGTLEAERFVHHRVFRSEEWTAFERNKPGASGLRQMLPARPWTLWRRESGWARGQVVARAYVSWAAAVGRVATHPGEIRRERQVAQSLRKLTERRTGPDSPVCAAASAKSLPSAT